MQSDDIHGRAPSAGGRLGTPESVTRASDTLATPAPRSPRRVEKPWGYELIWAEGDDYAGKLLFIRAGEALSLQFHEEKDETLYLLDGQIVLEIGAGVNSMELVALREGELIQIRPGTIHRIEAVTDSRILEASTPELDDVVRLTDRYGRAGTDVATGMDAERDS